LLLRELDDCDSLAQSSAVADSCACTVTICSIASQSTALLTPPAAKAAHWADALRVGEHLLERLGAKA